MIIRKKDLLRGISRLLFELIVVFSGVLLAFFVSNRAAKRNQKFRFEKTVSILQREISDFITYSPIPIQAMEDSLHRYDQSRQDGDYPRPAYYREPRAAGAPTAAWEALLASGAYEILDPLLFYKMTIYYNRIISTNEKNKRYILRCEDRLLPRLGENASVFYEDFRLRGEYRIQMELLMEIVEELKQLGAEAKALKDELEKQFPTLE